MSVHSRDDLHIRGGITQLLVRHTCPMGQSVSPTQSTQKPRAVSHNCPGHILDDVQCVTVTHRLAWHTCPDGQSLAARQSTHTSRPRSHTRPGHSRSE